MIIPIKNQFVNNLPADVEQENYVRKVFNAAYSFVNPKLPSNPKLIHVSKPLATFLNFDDDFLNSSQFLNYFSGSKLIPNSKPYAMAYAGHQFGNWAGQLGDGRAINLGEIKAQDNQYYTIQLKGAGKTPYSRTADGLAVLRSSIREHLCSEAMHYLGVPTTRSLSLISTGDKVLRDVLYNGNPAYEQGAVIGRVAPSFIRFGNFELFASQGDNHNLQKLVDYTVKNYFPNITSTGTQKVIDFFEEVLKATLQTILHWQRVGFVHGVMNTDNMSIHGYTIDYGPFGFMDVFDPMFTPNTTDTQKRYCYKNQPNSALYNSIQLANALYSLVNEATPFQEIIDSYGISFQASLQQMYKSKLGLFSTQETDEQLVQETQNLLQESQVDMTLFYRNLAHYNSQFQIENTFDDFKHIQNSFYDVELIKTKLFHHWNDWLHKYIKRLQLETLSQAQRKLEMNAINPKYILRNYMAQMAIEEAEKGNYSHINELFELLKEPYNEQPKNNKWFDKRPDWAKNKIGCSTLSCSS
jgi:uncharacterized protein YdiU (UPF0061 family)